MVNTIHDFQGRLSDYSRQLTLGIAYLKIGSIVVTNSSPDASVQLLLDKDIRTESMYLRDLLVNSPSVEQGILELYQNKFVAAWSDLLNDLYAHSIRMHFEGVRQFTELKKRAPKIDFSSSSQLQDQIRMSLIADFGFDKYIERVKLLNTILNPKNRCTDELTVIKKHVFIRNAVQHHTSLIYNDMLRELGISSLQVMDVNADQITLMSGDLIRMAIPELDLLKRALFLVSNEWRINCV